MEQFIDKDQIEDLIILCGSSPTFWRQNDMLVCCPVHGESNPSMGVSADKQVCHCFSCGFKGSFSWLLYKSRDDMFKSFAQAEEFFEDRYELEHHKVSSKLLNIPRYEDTREVHKSTKDEPLPMYTIAPFKSGKETYKYFYDRGFTKEDVQKFMIGRDLDSKTVTIPIFNKDGSLAGVIGRYISKKRKHNERFRVYSFERGKLLYPLDKVNVSKGFIIIIEGCFDAIKMYKVGYDNSLALMSNNMTEVQADIIADLGCTVIYVGDNDSRGLEAKEENIKMLKERDVKVLTVDYPKEGKDPCDWSKREIDKMIKSAHTTRRSIKRIR